MSVQPWSTVAEQWTLDGLYKIIERNAAQHLVGAVSEADTDAKAQDNLDRMARFYRRKLINDFGKQYPSSLSVLQTQMVRRTQRVKEFQNYLMSATNATDAVPPSSYEAFPTGSSITESTGGVYCVAIPTRPRLFIVEGPVTNATLAGSAGNGEYCGIGSTPEDQDMPAVLLYINRGTLASPVWEEYDSASLVDHIKNPEEILDCGYLRALFYMAGFATFMDNGEWDERMENMPKVQGITLKQALEDEAIAFNILDIDISGDGVISDSEKASNTARKWFF